MDDSKVENIHYQVFAKEFKKHIVRVPQKDVEDVEDSDSYLNSMKPCENHRENCENFIYWKILDFFVIRLLSLMPCRGLTSDDYRKISFDFISPNFIICISLRLLSSIEFLMGFAKIISRGFVVNDFLLIFLNGGGIIIAMNFIKLSAHWKMHMKYWIENEKVFTTKIYQGKKHFQRFRRNFAIVSILVIGYGFREF